MITVLRKYRIVENVDGRKHWRIWRIDGQSPKFSPSNLRNIQYPIFIVRSSRDSSRLIMSLLKYFRSKKANDESLPSPAGSLSTVIPSTTIVAVYPSITYIALSCHLAVATCKNILVASPSTHRRLRSGITRARLYNLWRD